MKRLAFIVLMLVAVATSAQARTFVESRIAHLSLNFSGSSAVAVFDTIDADGNQVSRRTISVLPLLNVAEKAQLRTILDTIRARVLTAESVLDVAPAPTPKP
jgi:hypothetical protein